MMRPERINPPNYFLACLIAALALHFIVPLGRPFSRFFQLVVGITALGAGLWINIWADNIFKRRGTTVKPLKKSTALVMDGPFAFSRHPMYLGMVISLTGMAFLLGSITPFAAPMIFFLIAHRIFIPLEEKKMEEIFGEKYRCYRKRVRCWI